MAARRDRGDGLCAARRGAKGGEDTGLGGKREAGESWESDSDDLWPGAKGGEAAGLGGNVATGESDPDDPNTTFANGWAAANGWRPLTAASKRVWKCSSGQNSETELLHKKPQNLIVVRPGKTNG